MSWRFSEENFADQNFSMMACLLYKVLRICEVACKEGLSIENLLIILCRYSSYFSLHL